MLHKRIGVMFFSLWLFVTPKTNRYLHTYVYRVMYIKLNGMTRRIVLAAFVIKTKYNIQFALNASTGVFNKNGMGNI